MPEDERRGRFASLAMELVAPALRRDVVEDESFVRRLDLATHSTINFQPAGVTFAQVPLLQAVREGLRGRSATATDEVGRDWTVIVNRAETPLMITLKADQNIIHLPQVGLLSENAQERISALEAEAERVNLPFPAKARWRALASERALDDGEISEFSEDINRTPIAVAGAITGHLHQESVSLDVLVPTSVAYYERLIGCYDGEGGIVEYVNQALPKFLGELFSSNLQAGLWHSLLLASHPMVIDGIASLPCDNDTFGRVIGWAI